MKRRGKVIALSTVAVGVAVLVATGFVVGKEWIREDSYLRKLEKGDMHEQVVAAEKLGEMRSVRSVKLLVRKLRQSEVDSFVSALIKIGKPATIEVLKTWLEGTPADDVVTTWNAILHGIYGYGKISLYAAPLLRRIRHDPKECKEVRSLAAKILLRGHLAPRRPRHRVWEDSQEDSWIMDPRFRPID